MNIPLIVNDKSLNIKELDNLNLELWRSEVLKKGVYTPQSFLSKNKN